MVADAGVSYGRARTLRRNQAVLQTALGERVCGGREEQKGSGGSFLEQPVAVLEAKRSQRKLGEPGLFYVTQTQHKHATTSQLTLLPTTIENKTMSAVHITLNAVVWGMVIVPPERSKTCSVRGMRSRSVLRWLPSPPAVAGCAGTSWALPRALAPSSSWSAP